MGTVDASEAPARTLLLRCGNMYPEWRRRPSVLQSSMSSSSTLLKVSFFITLTLAFATHASAMDLLDIVQTKSNLKEISQRLSTEFLTRLLQAKNITVFLPSNDAFLNFRPEKYGFLPSLDYDSLKTIMNYHIVNGIITKWRIRTNNFAISKAGTKVYFNNYETMDKMYYMNGAALLESDIMADNGVLHVIDRIVLPVGSNKTLAQYHKHPDLKSLSFKSINEAAVVLPDMFNHNSTDTYFTAFSPNDSFLNSMPNYGKDRLFGNWTFLQNVFKAHIILGDVYFLPTHGQLQPLVPLEGTLTFTRDGDKMYVSNNKVRAEIILPNIPIANGVIHIIDNLLYYVYRNVMQKILAMPETRSVAKLFSQIGEPYRRVLQDTESSLTVFVPTDEALSRLPVKKQKLLKDDRTLLTDILSRHIVPDIEWNPESVRGLNSQISLKNKTIRAVSINDGDDVYIAGGGIWVKIIQANIGCTNGVVHLITNFMFYKNFTLWEAIKDMPQLSHASSYISRYPEVQALMSSEASGHLTLFLPNDDSLSTIPGRIKQKFALNQTYLNEALKGLIVQGQEVSSINVTDSIEVVTLLGKNLKLWKSEGEFYVKGGHITARITTSDIWCSNGVIHVIDNLLFLPTRNIYEEIARIDSLSLSLSAMTSADLKEYLSSDSEHLTVFVPSNSAFWKIPDDKANKLMNSDRIRQIMAAHIANGTIRYKNSFRYGEVLRAAVDQIYIIKENGQLYVISNNVKARVTTADIQAINGVLHVIDEVLAFPYKSVAETMAETPFLREFYDILSLDPEFLDQAKDESMDVSVFAPSEGFLNAIGLEKMKEIKNDFQVIRKIFAGHVVQNSRLDWKYLRSRLRKKCIIKNQFNVSFKIFRNNAGGIYVDAGSGMQRLYLINPAIGCSNGIIYVIDGFLNYSPFNLIEMIYRETAVSHISALFAEALTDISDQFSNDSGKFTLFVPGNMALKYHSIEQLTSFLQEATYERSELILRHLITDHILPESELTTHRLGSQMKKAGVRIFRDEKNTYLLWKGIRARITKSNILASNGIIHVTERFLLMTDKERAASSHSSTNAAYVRTLHTIPPRLLTTPVGLVIPRRHKGGVVTHSRAVYATPRTTTSRMASHSEYSLTAASATPRSVNLFNFGLILSTPFLLTFTSRSLHT